MNRWAGCGWGKRRACEKCKREQREGAKALKQKPASKVGFRVVRCKLVSWVCGIFGWNREREGGLWVRRVVDGGAWNEVVDSGGRSAFKMRWQMLIKGALFLREMKLTFATWLILLLCFLAGYWCMAQGGREAACRLGGSIV